MQRICFTSRRASVLAMLGCLAMLAAAGCSSSQEASAANAANTAAQNASANVATTLNQNLTAATTASPAPAATAAGTTTLNGQWVRTGVVYNQDGTISTRIVAMLTFASNGAFISSSPVGFNSQAFARGTYQVVGNTVTIKIGNAEQKSVFQISGSKLAIISPNNRVVTFERP